MVSINATLVVQVVHFLFAWWFLERFFFRPFVRDVQKQYAQVSHLGSEIALNRAKVLQELTLKENAWKHLFTLFKEKSPSVRTVQHLSFSGILCPVSLSLEEKQRKVFLEQAKKAIVKKVLYDH